MSRPFDRTYFFSLSFGMDLRMSAHQPCAGSTVLNSPKPSSSSLVILLLSIAL